MITRFCLLLSVLILISGCGGGKGKDTDSGTPTNRPASNSNQQPTGGSDGGGGSTVPQIVFDSVPPVGSFNDLRGRALGVTANDYRVAVFIYVNGWWTKPYWDVSKRLTTINSDGSWTCDITTGGSDQNATKIVAYLVPKTYMPPIATGQAEIPAEVAANAVANLEVTRSGSSVNRVIDFAGYKWVVKKSDTPVGPPDSGNYFSDSSQDVWVDSQGKLHLKISHSSGKWTCSEVICSRSFGYGTYTFTLDTDPTLLDKNAVLGLFTWNDAPEYAHREIDIEFSKWANSTDPNSQYVIQPWDQPNHRHRFNLPQSSGPSVHSFAWSAKSVVFQSSQGEPWTYSGSDIPVPGWENPRINLWLVGGYASAPSDGKDIEVVVDGFNFTQ